MITRIARKEFTEIIREGRLRLALIVVLVLLGMSIVISRAYYASIQQQHLEAKENARNIWVSQDEKNPHSAAHYGTYAFKPKFPLALIDPGIDKFHFFRSPPKERGCFCGGGGPNGACPLWRSFPGFHPVIYYTIAHYFTRI
jgi:hypothetical protein